MLASVLPSPPSPPLPSRATSATGLHAVRVWDLPTRLFHWLLAAAVTGSLVSAWIGGAAMAWHFRAGQMVLALLTFRLIWGCVGGRWSRFASFVYAPTTVLRYLRGQVRPGEQFEVGHNPLGSWSVFALLGFLMVQVATGLVADDEISNRGPLNSMVSNGLALTATSWHKQVGQWLLCALVLMHLAAIGFYRWRKHKDLVRPMWSGDKALPTHTPASADNTRTRLMGLVLGAACAALAVWVGRQGG
jgi:cytochrome b